MRRITYIVVMLALVVGALASPLEAAGWLRIFLGVTPGPQPPAIAVVNPGSGTTGGGTSVVITGTSLSGATAVSFSACGAAASFVINGPSQITAVSPACAAQTVHIRVTTPVGISAAVTADQYQFNTPNVPSWVPFVGGQVASLYCDFTQGNYYYSGATQSSCPATVSRTGNETCTDASGNLSTATSNTACITTAGFGSTFGSFTNSLLQSSTFQNTPWAYQNINDTTFATTTTAPDGTNTAQKITETNATSSVFLVAQPTTFSANGTYTACGYLKQADVEGFQIQLQPLTDPSNNLYVLGIFHLSSQVAINFNVGAWSNVSASLTPSAQGFYRFQLTGTFNGSNGSDLNYGVYLYNNSLFFNGTTGNGSYAWGLTFNQGSACPPLIQTTTVAVTTNADVVTLGSPASTLLASTNASIQVVTKGASSGVASTVVDANGTVLLGENTSSECFTAVGTTLASTSTANWVNQATCSLSWVSGTSGTINSQSFATSDTSVARNPSGTFHLGSTSGTSAFLNGNVQTIAIYSPSVTFPTYVPVAYYFDSVAGSDTNNCQTTSTACASTTKMQSLAYNGGDSLNWKDGSNFTGCLAISASNVSNSSAANPVSILAYGSGAVPILTSNCGGNGTKTTALTLDSASVTVNGVNIRGSGLASNNYTAMGIAAQNSSGAGNPTFTIENVDISGFGVVGAADQGGEIFASGFSEANGFPSACGNVTVNVSNATLHGATPTSADDNGFLSNGCSNGLYTVQGTLVYDIGAKGSTFGGCCGNGILIGQGGTGAGPSGSFVKYSLVHDVGANVNTCGGPAGIFAYGVSSMMGQFSEVYLAQAAGGVYPGGGACDWDGFDFDGGVTGSIFEYVYAHNNMGGGAIFCAGCGSGFTSWGPNTLRYAVTENNNSGDGGFFGEYALQSKTTSVGLAYIYNMTSFSSVASSPCISVNQGTFTSGSVLVNSICSISGQDGFGFTTFYADNHQGNAGLTILNMDWYNAGAGTSNWTWQGSNYSTLAAWGTASGETVTGSKTITPGFSSPPSGTCTWTPSTISSWPPSGCPSAYSTISAGMKSAGLDLTQVPYSLTVGTRDYYANTIPGTGSCYNLGAYGVCP